MRVMVTGSRTWTDRSLIRMLLSPYLGCAQPVTIVHGAARGADELCAQIAASHGLAVEAHPADWQTHGRAAGMIRNAQMLNSDIDCVLAFCHHDSPGTTGAIALAIKRAIPVTVLRIRDGGYPAYSIEHHDPPPALL